MNRRA